MKLFKLNYSYYGLIRTITFAIVLTIAGIEASANEAKRENLQVLYGSQPIEYTIYHHDVRVVKQSDSPVRITGASATYIPETTAKLVRYAHRSLIKYYKETVETMKKYEDQSVLISLNATGNSAVAVQYGVHIYNSFNEYLGGFRATAMHAPRDGMSWVYRHSDIFTFDGYGYAFAFVVKVRLKDGTIWTYDFEEVNSQIDPIVKRLELDKEWLKKGELR